MAVFIDENFWRRSLGEPDWYSRLGDDFKRLERLAQSVAVADGDPKKAKSNQAPLTASARPNLIVLLKGE